jgi:hypothetical protein
MKRLASRLTWWHRLRHKSTPRSTPQNGRGQPWTILASTCTREKPRSTSSPRGGGRRAADPHPNGARVVNINALRALAPPSLRPRSQAVRPPDPHAAAPLEPQAQRCTAGARQPCTHDRDRPSSSPLSANVEPEACGSCLSRSRRASARSLPRSDSVPDRVPAVAPHFRGPRPQPVVESATPAGLPRRPDTETRLVGARGRLLP